MGIRLCERVFSDATNDGEFRAEEIKGQDKVVTEVHSRCECCDPTHINDPTFWHKKLENVNVVRFSDDKISFGREFRDGAKVWLCVMPMKTGESEIASIRRLKTAKCFLNMTSTNISITLPNDTQYVWTYGEETFSYGCLTISLNVYYPCFEKINHKHL